MAEVAQELALDVVRVPQDNTWLDAVDYHLEHALHAQCAQEDNIALDALELAQGRVYLVGRVQQANTSQDVMERQMEHASHALRAQLTHICWDVQGHRLEHAESVTTAPWARFEQIAQGLPQGHAIPAALAYTV